MTMMPDAPFAPPARGRPRSEARSAEMLWAAAQLFSRQGVSRTTTREIAVQAGTTERTLFKHFGSKDRLVKAVMEEAILPHLAPVSLAELEQAVRQYKGDVPAWHRALLSRRLAELREAPGLLRLLLVELLRDEALRDRFAAQWEAAAWQPLVALFTQLRDAGAIEGGEPASTARMFLSLNIGFLVGRLVLAPQAAWNDDEEIAAIAALFWRGMRPGP
jgi:AcrR family transcriptional regulator